MTNDTAMPPFDFSPDTAMVDLPLLELQRLMRSRELTAETLTRNCLRRIDERDPQIGAFLVLDRDRALAAAADIDRQRRASVDLGPLMGIPVAIKDLFVVEGMPTKAGSPVDLSAAIGPEGSFVRRLRELGCIILGKTRTTEFAYSPSGLNERIGVPRNPADADQVRLTGGSSSGSAAAVAAGLCPLAIGSDTGGSVRVPAALCGVAGLKTSPGLWASDGVFVLSETLDTIGLFTRTVEDLDYAFAAMQGAASNASPDTSTSLGLAGGYFAQGLDSDVSRAFEAACSTLKASGIELVPLQIEEAQERAPALIQIMAYELTNRLGRDYLLEQHDYSDPYVGARVRANAGVTAENYEALVARHRALSEMIAARTQAVPFWIAPTVPMIAPLAPSMRDIDAEMVVNLRLTQNTQPINLFSLCALSLPLPGCGLPVGLQLAGPKGREAELLALARLISDTLGRQQPDGAQ
jgi:aspartyl-tRNA(Asn)/glutamyl-tRNA(Gln) amidotransferase subunit A